MAAKLGNVVNTCSVIRTRIAKALVRNVLTDGAFVARLASASVWGVHARII